MEFEHHPLTIVASVLCCAGVVWLAFQPAARVRVVYQSATFLPTYAIGILAWFLHALQIGSWMVAATCVVQLGALGVMLTRALKGNGKGAQ